MSIIGATVRFLARRKGSYEFFAGRENAFVKDILEYCRVLETTYHDDPYMHARLAGRREVGLRILQHLNLTPEQMFVIFNQPSVIDRLNLKEEDNG